MTIALYLVYFINQREKSMEYKHSRRIENWQSRTNSDE
ncbi:Uncharacterized protein dnm_092860 [Desulfonema magnum]|uniref:Uncharacterized protein n=1 Tax=Desulfonema magnum TaxID=45655 RepID=A0A975BWX7_9BACT|nr:Uncharacterized protein dnm_092860 [Desulfonema magnum]